MGISAGFLTSTAPEVLHETLGTRIRRKMYAAATKINVQPVCMVPPWQVSTTYAQGKKVVNGGNIYVCAIAGMSAASGGPTGFLTGANITDNTAQWQYTGGNTVLQDPNTTEITWSAVLAVTVGQILAVGGQVPGAKVYGVVVSGNTGATAPTGTTNAVTDGAATLTYMGLWQANPYMGRAPTLTTSGSQPGGYVYYTSTPLSAQSPVAVIGIAAKGTGYAVNDTITLTGGTFSAAAVLTVTSVVSGGVTSVALTTPGTYTVLPPSTTTQGSTSGGGTGFTCTLQWPDPGWCHINNGYVGGTASTDTQLMNYSPSPGNTIKNRHISVQFETDDPAPVFGYVSAATNTQLLYDDGAGWTKYNQDVLPISGTTYFTLTFPGARKMRRFKVETGWASGNARYPKVGVNAASVIRPYTEADTLNCVAITDSLFDGNTWEPFSPGFNYANQLGYAMDWNVWDLSLGGTGYIAGASQVCPFGLRVPAALAINPDIMLLFGSTNDAAYTSQQEQNAVTACLQAIRGTVPAWVASTAYTLSQIVSNNGIWYICTTAGTSASSVGPTGLATSVTDGTVTWASMGAAPTKFFTGPIIVWGVESVSAAALTTEGYISTAVTAFAATDPYQNTWFVPMSNNPMPPIIGTYNNNPTPGGLTVSSTNNFSTYISSADSVHPMEIAVSAEVAFMRTLMGQTIIQQIH